MRCLYRWFYSKSVLEHSPVLPTSSGTRIHCQTWKSLHVQRTFVKMVSLLNWNVRHFKNNLFLQSNSESTAAIDDLA